MRFNSDPRELIKITKGRVTSREGKTTEFKESFNWLNKETYAKSIVAFANTKGGMIIFGIKDKSRQLIGLLSDNFIDFDEAKMTEYLNSVFSPEIYFQKRILQIKGKMIGILEIQESGNKPIIAIRNDREIKESDIYYRYTARTERIKYPQLYALIEESKRIERQQWKELFERVGKIGLENVAIMDVEKGLVEKGDRSLIIDERLLSKIKFIKKGSFREGGDPTLRLVGDVTSAVVNSVTETKKIRITNNADAPLTRISDAEMLKQFPLDYQELTAQLSKEIPGFSAGLKYHKLRKTLGEKGGLMYTRYLNPNKPNKSKKDYYSLKIVKEIKKHY